MKKEGKMMKAMTKGQGGRPTTVVGIDPDVERNGVATLDTATGKLTLQTLDFAHTLDYIRQLHDLPQAAAETANDGQGCGLVVVVEAGWMNHGNYHTRQWHGRQASASIGRDQGRNEQTSRLIGEMLRHWGIPYVFKKPLAKMWGGHDRKITAPELEALTRQRLGRTNQESRDAALLAWTHASMPLRLNLATFKAVAMGVGKAPLSAKNARNAAKDARKEEVPNIKVPIL